jgi:hypothetical protein
VTKLSNLTLLCSYHHRAVHEVGFGVHADGHGGVTFVAPDGRPIVAAPIPPPVKANAVALLRRQHADQGIDINANTLRSWDGSHVDYGAAVDCVLAHGPPARPAETPNAASPRRPRGTTLELCDHRAEALTGGSDGRITMRAVTRDLSRWPEPAC